MQDINIGPIDLRNPEDPEIFQDESFEMTDDYVRTTEIDLITLPYDHKGEKKMARVLTNGNIMVLVSPHGTGKSAFAEAIVAGGLNNMSDAFGFKINLKETEKILLIDTERNRNDMHRGWERIKHRASMQYQRGKYFEGNKMPRFKMVSYKFLKSPADYLKHLKAHAKEGYRLIIADVITDFLGSVNDEEAAKAFVNELMKIADENDCGIIVTIHPNPKDKDYKARGHIGTILAQKAESVFACFKADDDTRVITTDFSQGKVRNAYDKVGTAFMWDDHKQMHTSVYLSEEIKAKVSEDYIVFDALIEEMYGEADCWTGQDILEKCQLRMANADLTIEYVRDFIKERDVLYLNDIDGKYYMKKFGDLQAPF